MHWPSWCRINVHAALSRPSGQWNDDDFDVVAKGEVVGRIFKAGASVSTPSIGPALPPICLRSISTYKSRARSASLSLGWQADQLNFAAPFIRSLIQFAHESVPTFFRFAPHLRRGDAAFVMNALDGTPTRCNSRISVPHENPARGSTGAGFREPSLMHLRDRGLYPAIYSRRQLLPNAAMAASRVAA